jgi:plastocyanin
MRRRARSTAASAAAVAAAALFATPAGAQAPAARVNAEGNAFTGGLRFDPAEVSVAVGQVVRWTNTDELVPHTATENHGLWDLTGTYGQTPANPPGFGPGESRERPFEAGTHRYYCKVHPAQMKGTVAVPASVAAAGTVVETRGTKRRKRRRVAATWAIAAPAEGQVYDVEIRRGEGAWRRWRDGTLRFTGTFRTQAAKQPWSVRARLRSGSNPDAATDWSPVAAIDG